MTTEDYINNIPLHRRARFLQIRQCIISLFPNAIESMKYKMPTFELDSHWIALANQKSYLSVYTCAAHHILSFKQKYPKIKTGKGCLNIKDKDEFILEDLTCVIQSALTLNLNKNNNH